MKNQLKKTVVFLFSFLLLLTFSNELKAHACLQDWGIENNTDCQAICDIKFYCNGTFCGSALGVSINSHSTTFTPWPTGCTSPCTSCDVSVTLISLLTACPGMNAPVVSGTGTQSASYNCNACPDNASTSTLYWVGAQNLVTIGQ